MRVLQPTGKNFSGWLLLLSQTSHLVDFWIVFQFFLPTEFNKAIFLVHWQIVTQTTRSTHMYVLACFWFQSWVSALAPMWWFSKGWPPKFKMCICLRGCYTTGMHRTYFTAHSWLLNTTEMGRGSTSSPSANHMKKMCIFRHHLSSHALILWVSRLRREGVSGNRKKRNRREDNNIQRAGESWRWSCGWQYPMGGTKGKE